MRVLFHKPDSCWVPIPLPAGVAVDFIPGGPPVPRAASGSAAAPWEARLLSSGGADGANELHLFVRAGASVRVGGRRVVGGLKRLVGRREMIVVGGRPFFLALDEVARIGAFAGEAAVKCVRCQVEIQPGEENTCACPICGVVTHEDATAGRCCFSYGPCVSCGAKPVLGDEAGWTPELL